METTFLQAAWIAPMDGPPVRDGGIVFSDRILKIGPSRDLRSQFPDAARIDAGGAVILPGLVNAHCHLELSQTPRPQTSSFVDWVRQLLARGMPDIGSAVSEGLRQSLSFGITTVGDITAFPDLTRALLTGRPRVVSFGEIRAMAGRRHLLNERLSAALAGPGDIGLSPHAPYSIEVEGYRRALSAAQTRHLPITTHLAETPDEGEFLARHSGPLRRLWDAIGGWDDMVPKFDCGPIRFAKSLGILDYPKSSLAHVNYCDDDELTILAGGRASVIYCPRTHHYFGHPPHRWREMLAKAINVAIGTDSCASSPDLNLVEDLRLLHTLAPDVPAGTLWKMTTLDAARALGMHDHIGSITVGKLPDFVAFKVDSDDPLREILETDSLPSQVWVSGSMEQTRPTSP